LFSAAAWHRDGLVSVNKAEEHGNKNNFYNAT
jgi:hypothetical protein